MRHLAAKSIPLLLCALMGALTAALAGCASRGVLGRATASCAVYSTADLAHAELERAEALDKAENARCVDAYFLACRYAWQAVNEEPAVPQTSPQRQAYNALVARLLHASCRFGRLDPARGLLVHCGEQAMLVPVQHEGFAWKASDFQRLQPPPTTYEPLLERRYGCQGLGFPLVVQRWRDDCDPLEARFLPEHSYFAATAVLRFEAAEAGELSAAPSAAVLEFHNPLLARHVPIEQGALPLSADSTGPIAVTLENSPRTYFAGFVQPGGAPAAARLNFLEPYQPGKIPVVLIHGLFSDPQSWADLINDLRAAPGFSERFQLWVYRYPTGQGFLRSATLLRRELAAATESLDPACNDPALRQVVLVGHSMGGLLAKLQTSYSDEHIWSRFANRPLDEIITTEQTRSLLAANAYFDPSPAVTRVIFIATPHQGSTPGSTLMGRGASLLVDPVPGEAAMLQQLQRDNPQTLNPKLENRFPTSVDMLEPRSPLLAAMREMKVSPAVTLHNIVGVWQPVSLQGPSDGVVAVSSAFHPDCQSQLAVHAPHSKVHRCTQTSAEILRILELHAREPQQP